MKPLRVLPAALLVFALARPRARADSDSVGDLPFAPPPAARLAPASASIDAPRPPLEHVKPSVELIQSCRAEISNEPDGKAKADVLGALADLEAGAAQVSPEERQGWIDGHLGGFNAAVRELESGAPPSLALKAERNAAMLNGRADRWDESKEFAGKALARDPNDRVALVVRARANVGLQDYADAYADAARAAKVDPGMASAYTARAAAEYGMAQYLQALEDAKRALALDSLDATAYDIMKLSEGRTRLAAPDFGAGAAPQASDAVEREYHGMMQQLSQVEKSRQIPDTDIRPEAVTRLVTSAGAKLTVKDYWGAIAEADRALAQDPGNARALYYRAAAHNLLGQYPGAVEDATKGLIAKPTDVNLLDARSWAFDRMGRLDDAVADAHHALELNPRDAYALVNRAYADEQRRDYAAMLEDYRAAARLEPQFEPEYLDAARRHGLEQQAPAYGRARAEPASPRARTFGVVLLSSLAGGLLIALGLLHVGTAVREERTRTRTATPPRALESEYEIGRPIGQGGMGVVYRGYDRKLKRPVAIKTLRDEFKLDDAAKSGFLEEARTVAELHHPAIVAIHNIVEDERGISLVFELLEGRPLDEAIAERGRLSVAEAKRVLRPVCAALEYAHAQGVVHRDLKPSNVMLLTDGSVKVLDFGISRHAAGAVKKPVTQSIVGTPHYMAPEQESGIVRKESDLFSLGAVLYEAVTGARPFEGPLPVKLARGYRRASSRVPGLPPQLDALIDRALEPDPDKRVESAAQFWLALSEIPDAA